MSVETKQCSICVDAPPYRQCLAVGADEREVGGVSTGRAVQVYELKESE